MIVIDANEDAWSVCHLCREPFRSLKDIWLLSALNGGEARWVHKRCIEGVAEVAFRLREYRLRRGDFVLKALIQRLHRVPI
jgi:hypothetical protein